MIDRNALFRDVLVKDIAANAALFAAIGTRAWYPVARKSFINTEKAIVFHIDSGARHVTGTNQKTSFLCKFYGGSGSYRDAEALFQLAHDRLITYTDADIQRVEIPNDFQGGEEPGEGWPRHMARIQVLFNQS